MLGRPDSTWNTAAPTAEPSAEPARSSGTQSTISADLKIIGDLHSEGHVQILGSIEGDVNSRMLTVGEGAQIAGSITAETVQISGSIKGQLTATTVKIAKTAKIVGDIVYKTLAIEEGAAVEGQFRPQANASAKGQSDGEVSSLKPVKPAKDATSGAASAARSATTKTTAAA
ncbi:MAG: polymer-forming cytoskeletal protein [Alphaproteobacteria bacterium]